MACASVHVYFNGKLIRLYGGNRKDVRNLSLFYKNIDKEKLLQYHPKLVSEVKFGYNLIVETNFNKN